MNRTFAFAIGGAAGQGVATPGNIFARILVRRGLHLNAYNAYQSIIRGGHTLLTIRTGVDPVTNLGDKIDLLIPLNQDTMNRHLEQMGAGTAVIYNGDSIKPDGAADGVQLCALPVGELADITRNKVAQNTLALGAALSMMGVGFQTLADALTVQFKRKGQAVVDENLNVARAGYDYATANFKAFDEPVPMTDKPKAVLTGNMALGMGGAAAGVKFYCAYPMSPATGVLHWMAAHARDAGIMVRQGRRRDRCHQHGDRCGPYRSSGHVRDFRWRVRPDDGRSRHVGNDGNTGRGHQRAARGGPSTGVPTKTEQGDLWQMLGAGHGDYPRVIAAPTEILDCFKILPEIFNLTDRFQCPGIVLNDLLLSEGTGSVDPEDLDFDVEIDRGELITSSNGANGYKRYKITESGVSPRAIPGVPHHMHTASTDEHDEDGILISDEFTDPVKRRAMMEKRQRKVKGIEAAVPPPELMGNPGAEVTLIGWGSTHGVIQEAVQMLNEDGISANHLQIRWLVPLHGTAIVEILKAEKHTIIVENNYSGSVRAATCEAKPDTTPTGTSASTMGSPSCRTILSKVSKNNWPARRRCRYRCTK